MSPFFKPWDIHSEILRKEIQVEKLLFLQKDNPKNLFGPDPAFANANVDPTDLNHDVWTFNYRTIEEFAVKRYIRNSFFFSYIFFLSFLLG